MIISRTPFRISFFGGGTDYPSWYRQHGGAVLGTTIDKYCYITCRYLPPFFDHRIRVVYSKMENVQSADELQHPTVRETLRYLAIDQNLEIHHDADLPARSGLGSSSSFVVGLLHALHGLAGRMPSKQQLARESIHIEQDRLGEAVGSQDQVLAAHGGFNHVLFQHSGDILVKPITVTATRVQELNSHLMLCYTRMQRTASDVARTYVTDVGARERQLRVLGALVTDGIAILSSTQDIEDFGRLLHEAWQIKRSLSPQVSPPAVDALYEQARAAGAIGGKLLGAGGGGFLLLFAPRERQAHIREALPQLLHVPFRFERGGSQIVYFDPQEEYGFQAP